MYTSYFRKSFDHPKAISIAQSKPDFFHGPEYRPLVPPNCLLQKFHHDHDEKYYVDVYKYVVLKHLSPQQVYDDLDPDAVLLCWEKYGLFCHRHLVAEWLVNNLGIEVTEL